MCGDGLCNPMGECEKTCMETDYSLGREEGLHGDGLHTGRGKAFMHTNEGILTKSHVRRQNRPAGHKPTT